MANYNVLDQIFDQIDEILYNASGSRVIINSPNSKVSKNSYNGKTVVINGGNTVPYVEPMVEKTIFNSRYTQFVKCLQSIIYGNYPQEKKNGYVSAIERYLSLANNNPKNFRVLDEQIEKDFQDYKQRVSGNPDAYLSGCFDALCLIKKLLYQSKIARFQELASKTSN